jgi:hypothetical protein
MLENPLSRSVGVALIEHLENGIAQCALLDEAPGLIIDIWVREPEGQAGTDNHRHVVRQHRFDDRTIRAFASRPQHMHFRPREQRRHVALRQPFEQLHLIANPEVVCLRADVVDRLVVAVTDERDARDGGRVGEGRPAS